MTQADYLSEVVRAQLEGRRPQPLPEGVTVEALADVARRGHMEYLILGALLRLEEQTAQYREQLRGRVMQSVARTLMQVTQLKELLARFEAQGIVSQPLKGACLKFLYPSPEMREMSDIDILIGEGCMQKASQVLADMGYALERSIRHHDIYRKPPYMVVEAHRAIYDKTVDGNQYRYFSDFSRTVRREGCQYTYDFKPEDFYVYMLAHMAKHFYQMGCGIRNLVDIYVFRSRFDGVMDRAYIDGELEKCGLRAFAGHMERLTQIWLGEGAWTPFYEQLFQYMSDCGIYGRDENGIWNKFCEEGSADGQVSRGRLRRWYWFPPLSYMAEYYPWLERMPVLLPWAWLVRGVRGLVQRKGRYKRQMIRSIEQDKISVYREIYQEMQLHFK